MKKTNQPKNASIKTLRLQKETVRELRDAELAKVEGAIWNIHSLHSSCC